jgi:hypothetical protein
MGRYLDIARMEELDRLLHDLEAGGFALRYDGKQVFIRPGDKVTPELRARLNTYRDAIIAHLESQQAITVAVLDSGDMHVRQLQEDGFTEKDAFYLVQLTAHELEVLKGFKRVRFHGRRRAATIEWKEKQT